MSPHSRIKIGIEENKAAIASRPGSIRTPSSHNNTMTVVVLFTWRRSSRAWDFCCAVHRLAEIVNYWIKLIWVHRIIEKSIYTGRKNRWTSSNGSIGQCSRRNNKKKFSIRCFAHADARCAQRRRWDACDALKEGEEPAHRAQATNLILIISRIVCCSFCHSLTDSNERKSFGFRWERGEIEILVLCNVGEKPSWEDRGQGGTAQPASIRNWRLRIVTTSGGGKAECRRLFEYNNKRKVN